MTDHEIISLAREYAEEIYPNLSDKIISLRTQEIKNAERLIRFLLRRYCLVEKAKVIETYNRAWNEWNFTLDAENKANSKFLLSALESLFPEIAKEVEG